MPLKTLIILIIFIINICLLTATVEPVSTGGEELHNCVESSNCPSSTACLPTSNFSPKKLCIILCLVFLQILIFMYSIHLAHRIAKKKLLISEAKYRDLTSTKDKFFSIIAHDLKNSLTGVILHSELLTLSKGKITEEIVIKTADKINESSQQIYDLLEELVQWSRVGLHKEKVEWHKMDIYHICQSSIKLLKANAEKKDINLSSEIEIKTFVYGDYNMIFTIIRNLVFNAIKFTPPGGKVIISAVPNANMLEVSIKDTGVGIAKHDIDKIFKKNISFSKKGTNREEGTGLGLVLCKDFVMQNKGKIWVESEVGEGSNFKFSLSTSEEV